MPSIEISRFSASDIDDAYNLIQSTISKCYSGIYPQNAVKFFQDMYTRDAILQKNAKGTIVVARVSGAIIGIGSARGNEISGVFVSIESQGLGVGREIMTSLEKLIIEAGAQHCSLSVSLPSFDFYKSLNYKEFVEQAIEVGDGQKLHYWQANKVLA